jgi:hypothetical protein
MPESDWMHFRDEEGGRSNIKTVVPVDMKRAQTRDGYIQNRKR